MATTRRPRYRTAITTIITIAAMASRMPKITHPRPPFISPISASSETRGPVPGALPSGTADIAVIIWVAPVRSDVNTSKGDKQVQRVNRYVLTGWDGLPTGPKMAQLTDVYGQAIEAAATGKKSVQAALAKAQKDGTAVLRS